MNKSVKNSEKKNARKKGKLFFRTGCMSRQSTCMTSVKPFKSKNRDKIDLNTTNPNLKKGSDF